MFCDNNLKDFHAVQRGTAYALLHRLANSENIILKVIVNSEFFTCFSISYAQMCILCNFFDLFEYVLLDLFSPLWDFPINL